MAKVFLVDLEAVETRYTAQWKQHVPLLLEEHGHEVVIIEGPSDIPSATTPGAFLNFGGTNIYKASQVEQMGRLFTEGRIKSGDHFIFTDAWHPGIINLKYMSELLGIKITIHALWHAGSYDPQDFLGRLIGDAAWVRHAEQSFFYAIDHNYFATDFHIELFVNNLLGDDVSVKSNFADGAIIRSGWPMEYMPSMFEDYRGRVKKDIILFPHRIAPEKQVDIFKHLAQELPQYEWIVCQEEHLTKEQYHNLLAQAKIVFSANLQETLGISMYEGLLADAIALVPDRLSYSEMYISMWKYPSAWTEDFDSYLHNKELLKAKIVSMMTNYDVYRQHTQGQARALHDNFFSATKLLENVI